MLRAGVNVAESALQPTALADRAGARDEMGPLRTRPCRIGGVDGGHPHIRPQARGEVFTCGDGGFGPRERVEHQKAGGPPRCDMVCQALLERRTAGQRRHVTHPELRGGQLLDIVEHTFGNPKCPRCVTCGSDGHQAHAGRRRRAALRFTGEQRKSPVLRHEHVHGVVIVGASSLEPLYIPAVGEGDVVALHDRHLHVGKTLADPAHLAVVHRHESGRDVLRMSGTRAEAPRPAQPVATVNGLALAVRKELTTHRDPVVVSGEHLGETFIGEIRRSGECRWQVRDPDPTERTVLPGHFDPRLDHLGKRGLVTARR